MILLEYGTMALRVQYFTTQIYFTQSKFQFTQSKIHFTQLEIHFTQSKFHFTQSKFHVTQLGIHFTQLGIHFAQLKFSPSGPYFCYHQSLIYYKDWLLSVLFTMYRHVGKLSDEIFGGFNHEKDQYQKINNKRNPITTL